MTVNRLRRAPLFVPTSVIRARFQAQVFNGSASGTVNAPFAGRFIIGAWGGGVHGGNSGADAGGASGAYCEKSGTMGAGDAFNYTAGGADTASTVTGPASLSMSASSGGTATGGDTNTSATAGAAAGSNNGGSGGTAPNAVLQFVAPSGGSGGGGGAKKEDGNPGSAPGGGGGGAGKNDNLGGVGAAGRVVFIWIR